MSTDNEPTEQQALEARHQVPKARRRQRCGPVTDYLLTDGDGHSVALSELFGGKRDLLVVHSMGAQCLQCTLWADEVSGALPDLLGDSIAFLVASPDAPEDQARLAISRGWRFRMVSTQGSPFSADMGFERRGDVWPGVMSFYREDDGTIVRVSSVPMGPAGRLWTDGPLLDLLAEIWERLDDEKEASMAHLVPMGYWRYEGPSAQKRADEVRKHIVPGWNETEKARACVEYMQSGSPGRSFKGWADDRIDGEMLGTHDMVTPDDRYLYPELWERYIIKHSVKPPEDFVRDAVAWYRAREGV